MYTYPHNREFTSTNEYKNDILQVTAAISEGNSGGPLLNENGHVVGVISAYYVDGQNLNIGVTSNMLRNLLNGDSSPINLKYWRNRPDMPGEERSNANDIDTEGISGSVDNSTSEIEPLSLAEEWATVTLENLQGRWVGIDLNGDTEVIEIQGNYGYNYYLTVNGEVDYSSYMGEGFISIIDRSSFGKCPEVLFVILPTRAAYKRKDEVQKSYDAEWEASTKRMSDPAYVFTLYKAGYYIPPKYRETIKPLLMPEEALTDPTEQEYLWAKKVIEETKKVVC